MDFWIQGIHTTVRRCNHVGVQNKENPPYMFFSEHGVRCFTVWIFHTEEHTSYFKCFIYLTFNVNETNYLKDDTSMGYNIEISDQTPSEVWKFKLMSIQKGILIWKYERIKNKNKDKIIPDNCRNEKNYRNYRQNYKNRKWEKTSFIPKNTREKVLLQNM